jgi:hypothetical protein
MACSVCGPIGAGATANTGRDESFQPPITQLIHYRLDDREDLRECPACHAVFHWTEYVAFTGSGNNDEETLTRLAEPTAELLRRLRHHDVEWSDAELRALPAELAAIRDVRSLAAKLIPRALARALVPYLLDAAATDPWLVELVVDHVRAPADAVIVQAELARRPDDTLLDALREHVKVIGCSICAGIGTYPGAGLRRDALGHRAALNQFNGRDDRLGIWECPECASLFTWTSTDGLTGQLQRNYPHSAATIRACLFQATVSKAAFEALLAYGEDHSKPVIAYAMAHDLPLVTQFRALYQQLLEDGRPRSRWLDDLFS